MPAVGDGSAGGKIYRKFTTRAFSTGIPTTLAGTPVVSIYKDDSLSQSTAGVTLDVDFDSVTGLNHVTIDTSADGTFYSNGGQFYLVITTGTVGGVSVVGETVGEFRLAADLGPAGGGVNVVQWAGGSVPTPPVTGVPIVDAARTGTAQAGGNNSITLDAGASAVNDFYKGLNVWITSGTGAGQVRVIVSYNGNTKVATVDRQWQTSPNGTSVFYLLSANDPRLNNNLQVTAGVAVTTLRSGTAQGGSANSITLDSGASATNGLYVNDVIAITGGTGLGQSRTIVAYNGTSKVATVDRAWITQPDGTSTFDLDASLNPQVFSDEGLAQAGAATTITLQSTASAVNDIYKGSLVTILSGTGAGETKEITGYVGSSKVATVDSAWVANPDTTSAYAVIPTAAQATGSSLGTVNANLIQVNGTAAPSDGNGHLDVRLADAVAHGGTPGSGTGTLALQSVDVTNPSGTAFNINGSDGGLQVIGNGSPAISAKGNSVPALALYAATAGDAFSILADNGMGISVNANGNNKPGINIGGGGGSEYGAPIYLSSGSGIPGIYVDSGGDCVLLKPNTAGHGINIMAVGTGKKAVLLAGPAATDALSIAAGSGTPADVFNADGSVNVGNVLASALAEFFITNSGKTFADAISGSVVQEIAANAGGGGGTVNANIVSINSVSTSGVTTVNANIGTTQPINFQGSGASAMVKSDVEQIKGVNSAGVAGYMGLDWSHINAPTTTVDLSGTSIASVDGAVGSITGVSFPSNFSALAIAATGQVGINWANIANPTSTVNLSGTTISSSDVVASVTGSVGSVAGNVGGNVTGSVGSLATQAKTDVAGAVLNAVAAFYDNPGTIGQAINQSASAGDPLASAVPGDYVAGTAGYILGHNLDAAVSSRLAPTSAGRTLDISANGNAGIDWANIDSPTTTVNLSGTTIAEAQNVTNVLGDVQGSVTSVTNSVPLDLTLAVPLTNTANTVGDCLNAARACAFGDIVTDVNAKTLTMKAANGTTVHVFGLDSVTSPKNRTSQ